MYALLMKSPDTQSCDGFRNIAMFAYCLFSPKTRNPTTVSKAVFGKGS